MLRWVVAAWVSMGAGCGEESAGPPPLLPEDYQDSYVEVRDCRRSGDHDLNLIRVMADPLAREAYEERMSSFPEGAMLVKEEYEFSDADCTGPIKQWTVMVRQPEGAASDMLGWDWQRIDLARRVIEGPSRCVGCHSGCGEPPDGYEGTCAVP
jgi:hypothetical protein